MNLGIADAAELAERIIEGSSPVRHREGAAAIKITERIAKWQQAWSGEGGSPSVRF